MVTKVINREIQLGIRHRDLGSILNRLVNKEPNVEFIKDGENNIYIKSTIVNKIVKQINFEGMLDWAEIQVKSYLGNECSDETKNEMERILRLIKGYKKDLVLSNICPKCGGNTKVVRQVKDTSKAFEPASLSDKFNIHCLVCGYNNIYDNKLK